MKSIITNTILLISIVILALYLWGNPYFSPYTQDGGINNYNVIIMGILLAIFIYSSIFLISFIGKKLIAYDKGEFPPVLQSVIHAFVISFIVIFSLVLHIFHILTFGWSFTVCIIVLIVIKLIFN